MSDWRQNLPDVLDRAWALIEAGAARRNDAANRPVLATLSPEGWPEARTLVLRSADRGRGVLRFFTDGGSGKLESLRREPRATVHIWDAISAIQLRLSVRVGIRQGAVSRQDQSALPDAGLANYGRQPPPGTPISAPFAFRDLHDPASFVVLEAEVVALELLLLGETHQRARFAARDGWTGHWVSP